MKTDPSPEHAWLKRFEGVWAFTSRCPMGPEGEVAESQGEERVRMLGDLWLIGEAAGPMPDDGAICHSVMTIGYDPAKERFVGTWVGSPMTSMFVYEGTLDTTSNTLTLSTTGPDMMDPSKTAQYQDVVVWLDDNTRELRSRIQGADGGWTEIMSARYTRQG